MTITIDHIEDDKLRLRHHVTAGQAEHDADAILDGFDEMLEAIPETHHPYGSPMKVYVSFERDRRGRQTSRRIFLTLICSPHRV